MARQNIPITQSNRKGGNPFPAPTIPVAADDLTLINDGRTVLLVTNSDVAAPHSLTINFAEKVDGQTVTPLTITLAASQILPLGPYPADLYGRVMTIDVTDALLRFQAIRYAGL